MVSNINKRIDIGTDNILKIRSDQGGFTQRLCPQGNTYQQK